MTLQIVVFCYYSHFTQFVPNWGKLSPSTDGCVDTYWPQQLSANSFIYWYRCCTVDPAEGALTAVRTSCWEQSCLFSHQVLLSVNNKACVSVARAANQWNVCAAFSHQLARTASMSLTKFWAKQIPKICGWNTRRVGNPKDPRARCVRSTPEGARHRPAAAQRRWRSPPPAWGCPAATSQTGARSL